MAVQSMLVFEVFVYPPLARILNWNQVMRVIKQEMRASEESSLETKQKLSFLVRVKREGRDVGYVIAFRLFMYRGDEK